MSFNLRDATPDELERLPFLLPQWRYRAGDRLIVVEASPPTRTVGVAISRVRPMEGKAPVGRLDAAVLPRFRESPLLEDLVHNALDGLARHDVSIVELTSPQQEATSELVVFRRLGFAEDRRRLCHLGSPCHADHAEPGFFGQKHEHCLIILFRHYGGPITFSTNDADPGGAFYHYYFRGPEVEPGKFGGGYADNGSTVSENSGNNIEFTGTSLDPGDTVGPMTAFPFGGDPVSSGTETYGFEDAEADGTRYGYFTVTQTGTFDTTTGVSNLVDKLDTVVYDTTPGEAVTVEAVPEPGTFGLLAAVGTGLAGLAQYRRTRNGAAA